MHVYCIAASEINRMLNRIRGKMGESSIASARRANSPSKLKPLILSPEEEEQQYVQMNEPKPDEVQGVVSS
jgi:hypothetical protein